MNNEQQSSNPGTGVPPARDTWDEVGRQFQVLGETLAAAFRSSWNDPQNRQRVRAMQDSLEDMVRQADQAIQDAAASPQAQEARQEAHRVADSLREAGEQTVEEVRPLLLSALKQVNEDLQKLVGHMGAHEKRSDTGQTEQEKTP